VTLSEFPRSLRDWLLDVGLVLWISRVSAASVLVGLLLFLLVPQARDTFLEVRGPYPLYWTNLLFWGIFFVCAVLLWALPVHYSARRNLDRDPAFSETARANLSPQRHTRLKRLARRTPRALAALCLGAVAIGALSTTTGLRVPSTGKRAVDPSLLQLSDTLYRQAHGQAYVLAGISVILMLLLVAFLVGRKTIIAKGQARGLKLDSGLGRNVLIALGVVCVALFLLPISFAAPFVRATLIPLLLGGWVAVLGWLAWGGRHIRLPMIIGLFLIFELLTLAGDNHDIRTVAVDNNDVFARVIAPDSGVVRRRFDEKVAEWRRVNCGESDPCLVRPIVVAASGGASRAGFYTAALLGELVDRTRNTLGSRRFQDQLFASSSVSGSSTGAAFFVAALRDAGETGDIPCSKEENLHSRFSQSPPRIPGGNAWRFFCRATSCPRPYSPTFTRMPSGGSQQSWGEPASHCQTGLRC
jgi:hypothetical protein